jgi:hypothetical protein
MRKNAHQLAELNRLHAWCREAFLAMREVGIPSSYLAPFERGLEAAFARGHLTGLRMIAKDLLEWTTAFPPESRFEIDRRLRVAVGRGLFEEDSEARLTIDDIIGRGVIRNEDEYRLLDAYAGDTTVDAERRRRVSELLGAYTKQNL